MHAVGRPPSAFRKSLTLGVTVVARVGKDQAAHRAVLGRDFGLDASPTRAVTRHHDRPFHGNAQPLELLVVVGYAIVDIDERGGHLAVHRVGVISGQLLVVLV